MACPDADIIQDALEGRLSPAARAEVTAHAEACPMCSALLAELARALPPALALDTTLPSGETPPPCEPLGRGAQVGSFVVIEHIGAGAMGVVVAAYDPDLDRKVAVKLLRADLTGERASDELRARLLREAQAMAKLSHPNVITVHQVGTAGDQVFVVMEHVDGGTLRRWLAADKRSWRAIRDMFGRAGRGLAAAHAAGLVHRDFKPENVLVGADGRVRVTDFGLVGVGGSPATPAASPVDLTRTGTLMGTPRYMAPEQHARLSVDARADQFAFCVALYEALFGQPPFGGHTLDALAAEVRAGRVREPPARDCPGWLRRVVMRGLRVRPEERYPSMEALLTDLDRDRVLARRRAWALSGVGVVALAIVGWTLLRSPASRCSGAEDQLAGVWDPAVRSAIQARFSAVGKPYAADSFARVAANLDAYAGAWTDMHRQTCRATARGEQSAAALDLRMGCLGRRLSEARALTVMLAAADADVVEKSVQAAGALSDLAGCADVERLAAPVAPPADPAARAAVERVRAVLAVAKAQYDGGRYREALLIAAPALAAARGLGYRPLEAEALYVTGICEIGRGDVNAAEADLFRASLVADAARHDEAKVDAQIELLGVVADGKSRFEEAERIGAAADATLSRLGEDKARRVRLDLRRAYVLDRLGRSAEARAGYRRVLALDERPAVVASTLTGLASVDLREAKPAEAVDLLERALAMGERAYGPSHPKVALILSSLGTAQRGVGQFDKAIATLERAIAVQEAALGPQHPALAATLTNLCGVHHARGDLQTAGQLCRRALDIYERAPDDASLTAALNLAGQVSLALGRIDDALAAQRRALAIDERVFGPDHQNTGRTLISLGAALTVAGKIDDAIASYRRALAIFDKTLGADNGLTGIAHEGLAMALEHKGDFAEAAKSYARAAAIYDSAYGPNHMLSAQVHHNLGHMLVGRGKLEEGLREEQRALATFEKVVGPQSNLLAFPLTAMGDAYVQLHRPKEAVPLLERAVALREQSQDDPVDLAESRFGLAIALWDSGGDRRRARALALQAREALAASPRGVEAVAQVDAWLKSHH